MAPPILQAQYIYLFTCCFSNQVRLLIFSFPNLALVSSPHGHEPHAQDHDAEAKRNRSALRKPGYQVSAEGNHRHRHGIGNLGSNVVQMDTLGAGR